MQTPWAVLLCKFADGSDEPFPMQYYADLFTANDTDSPWNVVKYFHEYSHGTLDLTGSQVVGWFQLTQTVSDYNSLGGAARPTLLQWARQAATSQGVDLAPFYSVVVCTDLGQDLGSFVGPTPSQSGVVAQGPTTPFPSGLCHEMGHVYGLQHSRVDGSDADYQDPWDIMSVFDAYSTPDQEFSHIGPGVNASNMRALGWLDESRVWTDGGQNVDETITLRPHVRRDLPGYLAAQVLDYLIEFRVNDGWDSGIPRPAVLIHRFADGHSYLMPVIPGDLNNLDLIAGDSFGDPDPGPAPFLPLTGFLRVEVLDMQANALEAVLRIRSRRPREVTPAKAIDPLAVMLSESAYLRWAEEHHPHELKIAALQMALQAMTTEERIAARRSAQALIAYGRAVEEALKTLRRSESWLRVFLRSRGPTPRPSGAS